MSKTRVFYGWWVVAGCFVIMITTVGIAVNSFSVFFNPIVSSLGFSMGAVSASTTSVSSIVAMFAAIIFGKLISKINLRVLMTVSAIIYALSFVLYANSSTIISFSLCAVLTGIGIAGTYVVPVSVLITNWFIGKRGLAMGITMAGSGVGGLIFGPLSNWLILSFGWRHALLVLASVIAVLTFPVTIFIVKLKPSELGLEAYGSDETEKEDAFDSGITLSEASKTSAFWALGISILIIGILILGVQMHIPSYLQNVGFSSTFAALILAVTNAVLIFGKLIFGFIHDKYGAKVSVAFIFATYIITLVLLIIAKNPVLAIVFAVLFGISSPISTIGVSLWTAEVSGKKDYASIYSIMNVFLTFGTAVGSTLTGVIFDEAKSYTFAWIVYIGLAVIGLASALFAVVKGKALLNEKTVYLQLQKSL